MEAADQFFNGGYSSSSTSSSHVENEQLVTPEKQRNTDPTFGDNFIIEDLLDFSNEETILGVEDHGIGANFDNVTTGNSMECSAVTVVDSCNSSNSGSDPISSGPFRDFPEAHFSNDVLCVPYDDLDDLEWLSNIAEESFSSEDLQKLQLISGMQTRTDEVSETREFPPEQNRTNPIFNPELPVPAKARSKRPRAAPCDWSSRLLVLSPTTSSSDSDITSNSGKKSIKAVSRKREASESSPGEGRRCWHCATDKTPQWRTGPRGPKTLCNACGVRYKSGRLVPEYRPASSPTFVLAKHSNSHRKVLELRRQKEMQTQHQQFLYPNPGFGVSSSNGEDYLIHHHIGPDYRQLI